MKKCIRSLRRFRLPVLLSAALCLSNGLFASDQAIQIVIPTEKVVLEQAQLDGDLAKTIEEAKITAKNDGLSKGLIILYDTLAKTPFDEEKGEIIRAIALLQIKEGNYSLAEKEFKRIVEGEVPASEEAYADAYLRLGYLRILQKDSEGALEYFQPLSQGFVKTSQEDTADASIRTGALLRKLQRGPEAIDVFQQVAEKAPFKKDQLYAKLQLAGLLWESGKCDYTEGLSKEQRFNFFEQSKNVSKEIFEDPDVRPGTKAIAELIYLEDFYFQEDYETALDLAATYSAKWLAYMTDESNDSKVNVTRQVVTAQTWLCFCQYRTGDYKGCIETAHLIRSGAWEKKDPYENFNVFGYSLIYEAFSQEAFGNEEEGKRLRQMAIDTYPRWYDAVIDSVETKLGIKKEDEK